MPLRWTDNWTPFDDPSPYVDWWRRSVTDPSPKSPLEGGLVTQRAATRLSAPSKASSEEDEDQTAARLPCLDNDVPIARDSRNKGFEAFLTGGGDWRPDPGNLPTIPDDTIIVGVIDTGIALGHNRFREMDGSSRILAAWQQTAIWDSPLGREQPFLPFGREIYQAEIDELLRTHSGGTLGGWLDEDSFNRTTGVLDMARPLGHREVAGRYAHGTHVLDAAAGADPDDPEEADFRRRVKIIAVNLPGSITFGESGTFLDCFMIYAIQRISDVADAIWDKNHPDAPPEARRGYPVVINLSFGKQAGSKTTLDVFPAALKAFHQRRRDENRMPVQFVMPVGNDNLARCNAFLTPRREGEVDHIEALNWRVQPEDQSANYVEIWSECFSHPSAFSKGEAPVPLELAVVPPGQTEPSFAAGRNGQVRL
ncbi:MAG: S8 family serine peptidase, partial [Pseudomonadota bacterium]